MSECESFTVNKSQMNRITIAVAMCRGRNQSGQKANLQQQT